VAAGRAVVSLLLGVTPAPLLGQVALGPQFQVNIHTTQAQAQPSIVSDPYGQFTVVWQSLGQDGSGQGVFGRRYDPSGTAIGGEFRVNAVTTSAQSRPRVSTDVAGNFVVVWNNFSLDGSQYNPFGRRHDAMGVPLEPMEFRVNSYTTSTQQHPAVASRPDGDFMVVWRSVGQVGNDWGLFGQRYGTSGMPEGTEFRVSSETGQNHFEFDIGVDGGGNFVAVWNRPNAATQNNDVFFQRYDPAGGSLGGETLANAYTTNLQSNAAIAPQPGGGLVVVWSSAGPEGLSNVGIFGRRFDAAGEPIGADFHVNAYTTGEQSVPSVASDGDGNFVVAWESDGQDGQGYGIFARRFDATGRPDGGEFRVNSVTADSQRYPRVASAADGDFMVVWQSPDASGSGVFARRFAPDRIFRDGFEPLE
jgi:hypothetical protein